MPTRPARSQEPTEFVPDFAHPSEAELAALFDSYGIRWEYEPTTFVLESDEAGNPTLTAFANDTSAVAAGECRVVAHHTGKAPTVDVYADGTALFTGLSNGESQKADVPAGTYAVAVAPAGTSAADAVLEANVTCAEGTAVLVYAVGDLDAGTLAVASQTITGLQSAPAKVCPVATMPTARPRRTSNQRVTFATSGP